MGIYATKWIIRSIMFSHLEPGYINIFSLEIMYWNNVLNIRNLQYYSILALALQYFRIWTDWICILKFLLNVSLEKTNTFTSKILIHFNNFWHMQLIEYFSILMLLDIISCIFTEFIYMTRHCIKKLI